MKRLPRHPEILGRISIAARGRCFAALIVACVGLLVVAGCGPHVKPAQKKGYFGPTRSMNDVVAGINANNDRIRTLYLTHRFAAKLVETTRDGKRRETDIDGDGVIMYQAPDNLYMNGRHPLAGKLFTLGCNPREYWLAVAQEKVDAIWFGQMEHVGKPCVADIPIRPDLLREVLGVSTIDPNLQRFPAPVMKFNNDEDVYMFTWIDPRADRFIAVKEVWYDRATLRPRLVSLFGQEGRILLRAYLSNHRHVKIDGVPEAQQPVVPGTYDLLFIDTRSRMTIQIGDAYLRYKGAPEERAFQMPSPDDYGHQYKLDEACTD